MACALVAKAETDDAYRGAWTYDPATVGALATYLDATYGLRSGEDYDATGEGEESERGRPGGGNG